MGTYEAPQQIIDNSAMGLIKGIQGGVAAVGKGFERAAELEAKKDKLNQANISAAKKSADEKTKKLNSFAKEIKKTANKNVTVPDKSVKEKYTSSIDEGLVSVDKVGKKIWV